MRIPLVVGGAVCAAVLVVPAVVAEAAPRPSASAVTVCHFPKNALDPATPNPDYPFAFLLSTEQRKTTNRKVRRAVRSVQAVLQRIGITDAAGRQVVVDGSYGPQTAAAVKRFQKRKGLTVDGKVGPQTWRKLSRSCWMFH